MALRALVTGATGFVGTNLVRKLLTRGFRVRVLIRPSSNRKVLEGLDVEYARGDVLDRESVAAAVRACDVVFHVAAYVSMYVPDPAEMRRVNVGGTRNVLEAARAGGVRRVVLTSTVSAVGGTFDGRVLDETAPFNLDRRGFHYCITKHEAEQVALRAVDAGQDVVIVNPTAMFGPFDVRPNIGRMIVAMASGKVPAYTHGGNNYVGVEDVCEGHVLAFERGRAGQRYILGNENLTHKQIFGRIAAIVGKPPPKLRVPHLLVLAAGLMGEAVGRLAGREPSIDLTVARMSRYYFYFSHEKAARELGYRPGSLDDAMAQAYAWLVANGYLNQ